MALPEWWYVYVHVRTCMCTGAHVHMRMYMCTGAALRRVVTLTLTLQPHPHPPSPFTLALTLTLTLPSTGYDQAGKLTPQLTGAKMKRKIKREKEEQEKAMVAAERAGSDDNPEDQQAAVRVSHSARE